MMKSGKYLTYRLMRLYHEMVKYLFVNFGTGGESDDTK